MAPDLSRIEAILTALTIVAGLQVLLLGGVAFAAWRLSQRATAAIQEFDRRLTPIAANLDLAVTDARRAFTEASEVTSRVREGLDGVSDVTGHVRDAVRRRFSPLRAMTLGLRAGLASFRRST